MNISNKKLIEDSCRTRSTFCWSIYYNCKI